MSVIQNMRRRRVNEHTCTHADCDEFFPDSTDMKQCESCHRRFCEHHIRAVAEVYYCEDCAKCERAGCGKDAFFACASCGNLLCGDCNRAYSSSDAETGYQETGHVCRGGCRVDMGPREVLEVADVCPF